MKLLGDRRKFDRLMTTRRYLVASPTVPNLMLHACLLVICNLCVHMSTGFFGIFFFKETITGQRHAEQLPTCELSHSIIQSNCESGRA